MKDKIKKTLGDFYTDNFKTADVLWLSECRGNRLTATVMLLCTILIWLTMLLQHLGIYQINAPHLNRVLILGSVELLIPCIVCACFKGEKRWLKYLMLIEFTVVMARLYSVLTFRSALIMVLPVILSCRYFARTFTAQIAMLTTILFALSAYLSARLGAGPTDLNYYDGNMSNYIRNIMLQQFLPKWLVFLIISIICAEISRRARNLVLSQDEIARKSQRIESELSLASSIQTNMLPSIFPPFPGHKEINLRTIMDPAKEVGGDFYDYFTTDDNHAALVIADASGKGVPAALFTLIAKTLIKNQAQTGMEVNEIFSSVNDSLCDGNEEGIFVTAWMGILDFRTGEMQFANAGHNPPLLRKGDGTYEFIKSRPGFVLGGMDGIPFRKNSFYMEAGDRLFLYTDGVTEATNEDNKLYGEDRLVAFMNSHDREPLEEVLSDLRKDIDVFVGKAEQFDDITMLLCEYKGYQGGDVMIERIFAASDEALASVIAFIEEELEKVECPPKAVMQISVAIEEIFVNIAHYSYSGQEGNMTLGVLAKPGEATFVTKDRGVPFNPLGKPDPDITLPAEERQIGGLGIMMTKKIMNDISYKYKNGENILTMIKKF